VTVVCLVARRAAARRQVRGGERVKKQKKTESLATVTPLVQSIFDSMFQGQIDEKGAALKKCRCGICEVKIIESIDTTESCKIHFRSIQFLCFKSVICGFATR